MSTTLEQPPLQEPAPKPSGHRRALIIVLAVLVVIATATAVSIAVFSGNEEPQPAPGNPPSAGPTATAPSAVQPSTGSATPTPSQPTVVPFGYQPLWPFANLAEVEVWQSGYRSGGHSPWHLDASATALAFTTGYLKFTGINVVVSPSIQGNEALVAVGYPIENRAPGTAAVLHLAKFGTGADAPWEVVGSRDTTLTLTQPRYGTSARSPVTVGGKITGVDESIRVQVRQPSSESPIGETAGLPAGGENTPWSTTVTYQGATAPALTIVAFTGGHYTDVERFAITGIRPAA
ncbi:MAG TPA: hypothetical protein VGR06_04600 [Actinophytocola sp.]|jgi:hypothetical protein|uniref:hypothetical protein n=1 Tax=Actinophytocola sp. TaxID=1872138 RepID=UPI002DF787AC|nr:hypothetical protein [Actinophytocola sp.]